MSNQTPRITAVPNRTLPESGRTRRVHVLASVPHVAVLTLLLFGASVVKAYNPNGIVNDMLTCGVAFPYIFPVTDTVAVSGSPASISVGINRDIGGVVVNFSLVNNAYPQWPIDLLEARSSAGAAWQFTSLADRPSDPSNILGYVANQAAGNCTGHQWGYQNNFTGYSSVLHSYVNAIDWSPNASCSYDWISSSGLDRGSRSTSPCLDDPAPIVFDDGALDLAAQVVSTLHGQAILLSNAYTLRARSPQSWANWWSWQALYFNRTTARAADLRLYLVSRTGWQEGPIYPYKPFSILHSDRDENYPKTVYLRDLAYSVWVWNIFGLDIGVVVLHPQMPDGEPSAALRLATMEYCLNPCDETCGSFDFEVRFPRATSFSQGQVRTYQVDTVVGTLPQLADLGYSVPGSANSGFGYVGSPSEFYVLPPCRVFDTRPGAPLAAGETRVFQIVHKGINSDCGVPQFARAAVRNLTVVGGGGTGNIAIVPGDFCADESSPAASQYSASRPIRANNGVDTLSTNSDGTIRVRNSGTSSVHVLYDVVGYFK